MPEYDDTNRGVMFENDKDSNPNMPDYGGSINIEGTVYWISEWENISKAGKPYRKLSVRLKKQHQGKESDSWQQAREKLAPKATEADDAPINMSDIPF